MKRTNYGSSFYGDPYSKGAEIQVLVYGEDKRYVRDFVWEDIIDPKTKKSKKIKKPTGKYFKEKETDSSWAWVSLDKIKSVYVEYEDKIEKDKFGYNRAKVDWGEGLTTEEKEAREAALANKFDEKALARRATGPKTIADLKKELESKVVKRVSFDSADLATSSSKKPKTDDPKTKVPRDYHEKLAKAVLDSTEKDDKIQLLEKKIKDTDAEMEVLKAELKKLKGKVPFWEHTVDKWNKLPTMARELTAQGLQELQSFEQRFKALAQSVKTHFEGEVLNYNKSKDSKKDHVKMNELVPESLMKLWE